MKDLLKIMACGSVDDGKSTLLGHLMYNNGSVFTDQIRELEQLKNANGEIEIDFSLLLDGLEAEREQHITIDVAYRFFRTEKRSFIIADTPGHSEYTRNMAVGASFADLAIILVDASKGISAQTMRHFRICRLMGICDFVFAVNKMDLTGYSSGVFFKIKSDLESKIDISELSSCLMIPVSAKNGDNLNTKSENMEWYDGVPLLCYLDSIVIKQQDESGFIMPVQRVSRFENGDRGYQGSVESGRIAVGDTISVYPSTERSTVT
ncbi:MAG: GTP-binding protein, partial [Clostridia bacterium]|nr:GTP-binding protein [Clostridia bacterium]